MYYFAYIDSNNICQSVYAMPTDLSTVAGYIAITEDEYTSQSVIGKRWNAATNAWEEVVEYYYAIVDENDICINLIHPDTELIHDSHIAISAEEYTNQTYIGWWYNRETQTWHEEAPFAAMAAHSTDEINVGTTNECLTTRLNNTYTKTQVDDLLAGVSGGSGSAGTPGADGADGADGEDGGYYTPSVAADGTLSWTASKDGMPAVAPANIKGADGQDGAPGAPGAAGADGQDGTTVVVGTVTTGEAGTSAAVQGVLNTATNTLTLNFTIPRGAQGEQGVQGEKGDAGDAGSVDAYTKTEVDDLLNGKANSTHTHTEYASSSHSHSGTYAAYNHTHSGYASSSHTHSDYASSSHTHSNYFPTSGGTITGETNFSGGLIRVKGVQAVFHSDSQLVYGSNNMPTRIAGNAISATKSITVDSDRNLKENIADVNAADCLNFIDALDIKTYNYIGDSEECIGVIAQDIEDSPLAKYLVRTTPDGKKAVKVADLVFPCIIAVQALSDYVKRLVEAQEK